MDERDEEALWRAEAIAGDYHPSRPVHRDPDAVRLTEAATLMRRSSPADDLGVREACARLLEEVARSRHGAGPLGPAVADAAIEIAVRVLEPAAPAPVVRVSAPPPIPALRHCLDRTV